jgi:hypothetical protein
LQLLEIRSRAEVAEQQETVIQVGLENARRIQLHRLKIACDTQEWQAVLVLGRRIHHDEAALVFLQAKIPPEAGVAGRRDRLAARDSVNAACPLPQSVESRVVRI